MISVEHLNEAWLSLVERCVRDAEVACSNHVASIGCKDTGKPDYSFPVFFCAIARQAANACTSRHLPLPAVAHISDNRRDFLEVSYLYKKRSYPSAFLRRVRSLLSLLCAYFSSAHLLSDVEDMVPDTFKVCKHF